MSSFLESYIDGNPMLTHVTGAAGGIYSIYRDLWEDVKINLGYLIETDKEFKIKLDEKGLPTHVDDYWFESSHGIPVKRFLYISDLLKILSNNKHNPSKYIIAENTFGDFIKRLRKSKGEDIKISHHSGESVLDAISLLAGSSSFRDYARKKYLSDLIKVVILPFGYSPKTVHRVERLIKKHLKMRFGSSEFPIVVEFIQNIQEVPEISYVDFDIARRIGVEHQAQLVIFGELFLDENPQKSELCYVIIDPIYAMDEAHKNISINPFQESEIYLGHIPNNLDAIIYHSLAMGSYLKRDYVQAILQLRKILDLPGIPLAEVFFRIAVIYDILDNHSLATEFYKKSITESSGDSYDFELTGDFIRQQILQGQSAENEALKIVYFEIARKSLSTDVNKNGKPAIAKMQLERALVNLRKISIQNDHQELLAAVHLDLGIIFLKPPFNIGATALHDGLTHLFWAIEYSPDLEIHKTAAPFFLYHGELDKARKKVKKKHENKTDLMVLYLELKP